MQQHNFEQGSPEWHEHRRTHFNASDAPAMLGISKYKSRTQLMHEMHTGITPDVDSATQKRFDDGHRFEALARPLAEDIIGKSLYPVVGSEGNLSASFDGLTIMEDIAFEHKSLNAEIRNCADIGDLSIMYKVQMQQQMMVSGAEKCLFMATSWNVNDELIESKHFWYLGDDEIAYDIMQGWTQFAIDRETYVPIEKVAEVRATPAMQLPAITYKMNGLALTSNLDAYKEAAIALVEESKKPLTTDQEFADREALNKELKESEVKIDLVCNQVDYENMDIATFKLDLQNIKEILRVARLNGEKLVATEKDNRKLQIIQNAQHEYLNHINALYAETKPIEIVTSRPDFAVATKNKKTLSSMQEAVAQALVNAKMESDKVARDLRTKQAWFKDAAADHEFLFHDLQTVIYKQSDDFELLVTNRIEQHKKATAARDAEIKAQAEADALAKVEAERLAKEKSDAEEARLAKFKVDEAEAIATAQAQYESKLTNNSPVETVVMKPAPSPELRAVVVEQQDVIASFFRVHNINPEKFHEYRAVIVEFIKHQASFNMKQAA